MKLLMNMGRISGGASVFVLAILFHGCVVDPVPPPLRIYGLDTVSSALRLDYDTLQIGLPRTVIDSVAFDTTYGLNPSNSLLDTMNFKVRHRTLRITDFGIREFNVLPKFVRRLDSGLAGARYPIPAVVETLSTFETRIFSQQIPKSDSLSMFIDTVLHVQYPNALPILGFMPLGDSLVAEIGYPETRIGPLPVLNLRRDTLQVIAGPGAWSGTVQWRGLDSLALIWPPADSLLGKRTGTFTLSDAANLMVGNRPYSISRVFRNLVPTGSNLGNYWALTAGPTGFLDLGSSFSFTTTPNFGDSLTHLRTRFELEGDFAAEVTVRLAPNVLNGYMVSLFASADSEPLFFYEPVTGSAGRMSVLSEGAGVCFNVSGTVSDLVSFSYDTYAVERNAPLFRYFRLRCERRGNRFTYSIKDAASLSGFQILRDYPYKVGTVYPPAVYLNMALGNFQPLGQQLSVEWENFVILEGKVVGP